MAPQTGFPIAEGEPDPPPVLVIGCGRSQRRDDQLGLYIAARLAESPLPGVRVIASQAPGADLLTLLDGVQLLIIADAARGGLPGQWRRIVLASANEPESTAALRHVGLRSLESSHLLGVADALQVGDELHILPAQVWIYAVAGGDFGYGMNLSPRVARTAPLIVDRIRADIAKWQAKHGACHA